MEHHFDLHFLTLYAAFEVWPLNASELEETEGSRRFRRVKLHKGKLLLQLSKLFHKTQVEEKCTCNGPRCLEYLAHGSIKLENLKIQDTLTVLKNLFLSVVIFVVFGYPSKS